MASGYVALICEISFASLRFFTRLFLFILVIFPNLQIFAHNLFPELPGFTAVATYFLHIRRNSFTEMLDFCHCVWQNR